jgi:hypothetical protein
MDGVPENSAGVGQAIRIATKEISSPNFGDFYHNSLSGYAIFL